jgi:hypothetical protein
MKKKNKEAVKDPMQKPEAEVQITEAHYGESEPEDVNTIHEFLEIKKLQNRILEKMLQKMDQIKKTNNTNNK